MPQQAQVDPLDQGLTVSRLVTGHIRTSWPRTGRPTPQHSQGSDRRFGAPRGIRTPNRQIRRLVVYVHPVRLSAVGAAQGRRRIKPDRRSPADGGWWTDTTVALYSQLGRAPAFPRHSSVLRLSPATQE